MFKINVLLWTYIALYYMCLQTCTKHHEGRTRGPFFSDALLSVRRDTFLNR